MMTKAKQYLKQAYRLNELINSNLQELQDLKQLSLSISAIDYSKERVQGGSSSSDAKFVDLISKIVELEEVIDKDVDRFVSLKIQIRDTINAVENLDEQVLLRYRYINFLTWEQICEKMNVSLRTIHRIHSTALKNVKIPN
ncbi:DNA-directed RNA polymerase specialized sigma subunit [Fontibacillus solani]|uniref:DNA-directed RNA polymerase specialized sigma subunit n=1 Tax=Fontibacillus solani TaxID=1572857 RepID=A0A7W3XTD4_9BACL|nr:DUF1492 domain-containing protein [Fontibacillus solani]MBA9087486.1 DNA-directed RNA polymerase specialized sigma subunit [Fontibacillus solani]